MLEFAGVGDNNKSNVIYNSSELGTKNIVIYTMSELGTNKDNEMYVSYIVPDVSGYGVIFL